MKREEDIYEIPEDQECSAVQNTYISCSAFRDGSACNCSAVISAGDCRFLYMDGNNGMCVNLDYQEFYAAYDT
jgi:hypothetical protein